MDTGDFIVVVNVDKIKVTGNKAEDKKYFRHSGYPGGITETNFTQAAAALSVARPRKGREGMLPKARWVTPC